MSIKKFFITSLYIIVLITSFFYLFIGKLNAGGLAIILIATAIVTFILWNIDVISEIKGKFGGQEIFFEVKKIRDDIYAKVKTVKTLGEEVAELTAFNITRIGRWASEDLQERILDARDKIKKILTEVDSDPIKIKEITSKIEETVLGDLKHHVYSKVQEITSHVKTRMGRDEIHNRVKKLLRDYNRDSLVEFLKSQGIYIEDELEPLLDKLDRFIQDKKL